MTEKVLLADIKNGHKIDVSLCASVSSVVKKQNPARAGNRFMREKVLLSRTKRA